MEKVAAGAGAGFVRMVPLGRATVLALACFASAGAFAQAGGLSPQDLVATETRSETPVRLEVNTSTLPRLDSSDNGMQPGQRVDLALVPEGRSGLGVAVGMTGANPRPGMLPGMGFAQRTNVELGVKWRQVVYSQQVDVTAWRRVSTDDDAYSLVQSRQPVYGARVEMKLDGDSRSRFKAEKGFIGMQLEGGAKISIKRRNGGPMVYYRTAF
jgi:hypothetical protein